MMPSGKRLDNSFESTDSPRSKKMDDAAWTIRAPVPMRFGAVGEGVHSNLEGGTRSVWWGLGGWRRTASGRRFTLHCALPEGHYRDGLGHDLDVFEAGASFQVLEI